MLTTVVGSFPFKLKSPDNFLDKIKNSIGLYNPYKLAVEYIVSNELNAGIDIVSDGGVHENMNMINMFSRHMRGMKIVDGSTVIKSKILPPNNEITVKDINYADSVVRNYIQEHGDSLTQEDINKKGVKAVVTGPTTMVYSSMIEGFYKNKDDAVIDYANAFKGELKAIEEKTSAKYIQIDEPMFSTGIVNMDTAHEAIDILTENISIPVAVHTCGNITGVYRDLAKLNVDILDLEFAGNDTNFKVIKNNISKFKNKKIGFGCLDSSLDMVDDKYRTRDLIHNAVNVIGEDNLILDPDCGLAKLSYENAYKKLELMCNLNKELDNE